jgi:lantibiotic leader peptide-processing serine protease
MVNRFLIVCLALALSVGGSTFSFERSLAGAVQGYLVLLEGQQTDSGFALEGSNSAVLSLVQSAGGEVLADLSSQTGVLIVKSDRLLFADTLSGSSLIQSVVKDFGWKAFMSLEEAQGAGLLSRFEAESRESATAGDPLESLQWSMQQIRTAEARQIQPGSRSVLVGILDSGIDGHHLDFDDDGVAGGRTNVDCTAGRDFVALGPGVGNPDPCVDNQFHGTHVAGIVAAQANGVGVVGVAPNVTLVPVKVCDAPGYCYASSVVAGITYAGDAGFDVINMSFFTDDDALLESTEFKCMDDETQRGFRQAVERAVRYARGQGVTPVAALGNSDADLANPPGGNRCEVVPVEVSGVIGTMALGPSSEKASYSNYGVGATDVAAPGGNGTTGDCTQTVLSTFPGSYGCIQGTSMASPHTAGVAALIVSQFGTLGPDGDMQMSPTKVEAYLQGSTIDIGLEGYDKCFGKGRIDAYRAVLHETASVTVSNPLCPEYSE